MNGNIRTLDLVQPAWRRLSAWMAAVDVTGLSVRRAMPRVVRMAADAIIVITVFLAAPLLDSSLVGSLPDGPETDPQIRMDIEQAVWAVVVAAVALAVFAFLGFYSRGAPYRGNRKSVAVIAGVSALYLSVGAVSLTFSLDILPSWPAFGIGWLLSLVILASSRLWSDLWRHIIKLEQSQSTGEPPGAAAPPKVLVIGGAGYIGSALLPKLLEQGRRVRILDLMMYGEEPIRDLVGHPDVEVIKGDFRQIDVLVRAMRGVDEVVHLGGLVGDPACAYDEELTLDINLASTRAIAQVAKGEDVGRFVFASTCSVYGASDQVLDERSATRPLSLYARTKLASEKVLLELADEAFQPVVLRFATIYGLSGRTRFDLVVNLLTAKAVLEGEITIHGGDQWRPFLHVDDAALAIALALEHRIDDRGDPPIFNVGSNDQNYQIRRIGELVRRHVPEALLVEEPLLADGRNYRVNFEKVHEILGFTPRWTVETGIEQVVEPLVAGRIVDYRHPAYSNAEFLTNGGSSFLARPERGWAYMLAEDPDPEASRLLRRNQLAAD